MNILITGIQGFVGSNLVAALKEQHTIYGLDIVSPQKEGVVSTFGWNELEQVPPVDCIIHLAGKAHDTKEKGQLHDGEKKDGGATGRRVVYKNIFNTRWVRTIYDCKNIL